MPLQSNFGPIEEQFARVKLDLQTGRITGDRSIEQLERIHGELRREMV
jgi:hypothetical protein